MAEGGRRAYDWRPWLRPSEAPEAPATLVTLPTRARRVRSGPLTGLFVLACVYTLSVARPLLLPLAVTVMVYFLLRPPVRALREVARVPEPAGAALVLLALVLTAGLGLYALSWPAAAWMARGPESLHTIETRLRPLVRRVERLTRTAAEMERITDVTSAPSDAPKVEVREASLRGQLVGGVQSLVAGTVVVLTLVYFLLAEGDGILRKIVRALPRLRDRKRAVEIAGEMERQISAYLFFTTLVNATFGALVAAVLWTLGMPNVALWGFVAFITKFVPYLGGLACTIVLALAALVTFADPWRALLVPAVFFTIDTLHGNLVVPALLGRRFTLDTAVLFVGLLFWWFLWGTAGALLAVPMMAAFRIFCERVEGLQGVAQLMSGEPATSLSLGGAEPHPPDPPPLRRSEFASAASPCSARGGGRRQSPPPPLPCLRRNAGTSRSSREPPEATFAFGVLR